MMLAVLFVPIVINFGLVVWVVPNAWGFTSLFKEIFRLKFRHSLGFGFYSLIYSSIFYLAARVTFWVTSRLTRQHLGLAVQCLLLVGLFSCSFLRVLTYSSMQGRGGTYTFWGAVDRYFERRHQLAHPTPKTSAGWQLEQISLHGEWYPSVALRGAAEGLEDYLNRVDLRMVPPRPLTVYLDDVLSEQILPEHRTAYAAALDEIFARAVKTASARGIDLRRGVGRGDAIVYPAGERDTYAQRASADPKLAVTTHMPDGYGLSITITNIARTPYTRTHYGKDFRGPVTFMDEESIQW